MNRTLKDILTTLDIYVDEWDNTLVLSQTQMQEVYRKIVLNCVEIADNAARSYADIDSVNSASNVANSLRTLL